MSIHPTASISPECELGEGVEIGPHCVITGKVRLGAGVRLLGHVYVCGPCSIGENTILYPFVCIGYPGQDVKFKPGDPTAGVVIGKSGILREHVTIHAATNTERPTTVGDRVFMMVNTHFGHDCQVGSGVVMVNNSAVGGHGQLFDNCTIGGGSLVHQYTRVGRFAFMGGGIAVSADIPPFCIAGDRNRLAGVNVIGLRRAGFQRQHITELRTAFREFLRNSVPREETLRVLRERGATCPPVMELADFIASCKRSVCIGTGRPPRTVAAWIQNLRRGKVGLDLVEDEEEVEQA